MRRRKSATSHPAFHLQQIRTSNLDNDRWLVPAFNALSLPFFSAFSTLTIFKTYAISIVSHGHGAEVEQLLKAIGRWSDAGLQKVLVTVNVPDLDTDYFKHSKNDFPFELCVIRNQQPRGFGANHNHAFKACMSDCFLVLNPDLELPANPFPELLQTLSNANVGCAYPTQAAADGRLQDFERDLPTPFSILKRQLFRHRQPPPAGRQVQWVSGAFMAFKTPVFRNLGGFDERYFMYCEDVDICLRLQLAGFTLARTATPVVHHAQRQTLSKFRHLTWHVRSLFRLWNSPTYQAFKRKFLAGESPK